RAPSVFGAPTVCARRSWGAFARGGHTSGPSPCPAPVTSTTLLPRWPAARSPPPRGPWRPPSNFQQRRADLERRVPAGHRTRRRHVRRRLRQRGPGLDHALPPPDIAPLAELVTDPTVDADLLEADRLVQSHAARVRQRDSRIRVAEPLEGEDPEERGVQRATHAPAPRASVDVHGGVDRPEVGAPSAVPARVHVTEYLAAGFRNEPGERGQR